MKKILTILALVSTVGISHGAAIDWNISGINSALSNYDGTTAASTKIYLILADTSSLATITDVADPTSFESALSAITLTSTAAGSDGKKPAVTSTTVESSLLTSGQSYTFGMMYMSTDTEGNGYYKIVTQTKTAYDTSDPSTSQAVGLSWATMKSSSWTKGYTAAVPEPSTAMLALAGLALLIKRRRA